VCKGFPVGADIMLELAESPPDTCVLFPPGPETCYLDWLKSGSLSHRYLWECVTPHCHPLCTSLTCYPQICNVSQAFICPAVQIELITPPHLAVVSGSEVAWQLPLQSEAGSWREWRGREAGGLSVAGHNAEMHLHTPLGEWLPYQFATSIFPGHRSHSQIFLAYG
jgi:hypothetical protein